MPLQQLFTSRKGYDASTYVARYGRMFFDEATGHLRLGDGSTPGGKIVSNLSLAATSLTPPINPYEGELWYNPSTKELWAYYNGDFRGTINPATTSTLGGVKLGPGVILNGENQIIVDATGLDFSFGDFYAFTNTGTNDGACLSSINPNQDVNVVSNGTGTVNIVGIFNIHKTTSTIENSLSSDPVFVVDSDGQVQTYISQLDSNRGAFSIIGSSTGNTIPPGQPGAMLHVTGQLNQASRIYLDGNGNFTSIIGRRWNGSVATATQVLAGEDVLRIGSTAQTDTGMPSTSMAQIKFVAIENQTTSTQGSQIQFIVTTPGTPASTRVVGLVINANSVDIPGPVSRLVMYGDNTGTVTLKTAAIAGSTVITLPATTGTLVTTGDIGSISNTMLAGGISNNKLSNNTISNIPLGSNLATLTIGTGLTGVSYNGSTGTTVTLNTSTLMTNAVSVTSASQPAITSVGTLTNLTVSGSSYLGNIIVSSSTIYHSLSNADLNIGLTTATANVNINRKAIFAKDIDVATTATVSNLNVNPNGTVNTPVITITDGGIRQLGSTATVSLDFRSDSIVQFVQANNATIDITHPVAGRTVKVIMQVGGTAYTLAFGISNNQNSTNGATSLAAGGSAGINPNQCVILDYTCVAGTTASTYVAVTFR